MAYLLGYGLWFAITVVALVVIYLTMLCYLKFRVNACSSSADSGLCGFSNRIFTEYTTEDTLTSSSFLFPSFSFCCESGVLCLTLIPIPTVLQDS